MKEDYVGFLFQIHEVGVSEDACFVSTDWCTFRTSSTFHNLFRCSFEGPSKVSCLDTLATISMVHALPNSTEFLELLCSRLQCFSS